jgi:[ribosomal protein S5]-alanine N-acetyltransferase
VRRLPLAWLGAVAGRHTSNVERQVVLTTRRIVVTTWLPEDVDDLCEVHSDPLTMRFVGPGRPESREGCDRRLAMYLNEQRIRGWTKWRVQTTEGAMIGRAGFGAYGPNRELGYILRPASWGRGLATELAQALVDWHMEHPDPGRPSDLWAYAAKGNAVSRWLLEKVGFDFIQPREHHGSTCAFYVLKR